MRKSKVLAKIRAGKQAKIAYMGHFFPPFIAYAAEFGYDGIWLDLEHRAMEDRELQALLGFFHLYDIDCILRPPTLEKTRLYRYLEDGATGLMIPQIHDVDTVRELVQKVKFPPLGDRGLEGRGLDANFGLDTFMSKDAFVEFSNHETILAIQIETPGALKQVEDIAAVEGVDILFVGPTDLQLRMQQLPEGEQISLIESLKKVDAAAKSHQLGWGCMPRNPEQVKEFKDLGSNFLLWGIDIKIIMDSLKAAGKVLDDVIKAKA